GLAVAQREKTDLAARQIVLDHHLGAGNAEAAAKHHGDGLFRLAQGVRDHHALAGRKAVGLDHDRYALFANITKRVGFIVEAAVGRGRNAVLAAEILGETLRAFELAGGLARPEGLDAGRGEIVDNAGRKRRLRADDDQLHVILLAEIDHRAVVGNVERDA